jgi:hypothetical protein
MEASIGRTASPLLSLIVHAWSAITLTSVRNRLSNNHLLDSDHPTSNRMLSATI